MVQLMYSGNLVVREDEDTSLDNYLWQRFDYPSNTLLPGMKFVWDLRKGFNRRLSTWLSSDAIMEISLGALNLIKVQNIA